ncbi:MAG: serine/threonine-protein phosphatase [Acidobacteriia bacterium]|nr:serine/threonine-protein phosphatase [Terriglobia bacterium]
MGRRATGGEAVGRSGGSLPRVVIDDFRSGGIRRGLREDFRELYRFYFDEDERERLARMRSLRRWLRIAWHLLRALILRLSPVRRILLLVSLFLTINGAVDFSVGEVRVRFTLMPLAYALVLLVLLLELKDKLLARDEIEVARQVQLALLPREQPRLAGWSLWCSTRPANDVGGDLVDHVALAGGSLGIVLGDVAGKGLGAALLSAKLQASLRAVLPECRSLADLGARLNAILHRDGIENRFATLFYAEIIPESGRLRVLNAGHNPALLFRRGGTQRIGASAPPLGMFGNTTYREEVLDLEPGDLVVAFSDGLTEARNARDEEFGEARIEGLASGLRGRPATEVGERIVGGAEAFLGERRPHDHGGG